MVPVTIIWLFVTMFYFYKSNKEFKNYNVLKFDPMRQYGKKGIINSFKKRNVEFIRTMAKGVVLFSFL